MVVASLGTNDDPGAVSSFDHSVRTALRAVGRRGCVVWPNIVRPPGYGGYNGVLRRLARKRRNPLALNWTYGLPQPRLARRRRRPRHRGRLRGLAPAESRRRWRKCRRRVVRAGEDGKKGKK